MHYTILYKVHVIYAYYIRWLYKTLCIGMYVTLIEVYNACFSYRLMYVAAFYCILCDMAAVKKLLLSKI